MILIAAVYTKKRFNFHFVAMQDQNFDNMVIDSFFWLFDMILNHIFVRVLFVYLGKCLNHI